MPEPPRKGESQKDFIARCMKHLVENENKTGKPAAGQCYEMWRNRRHRKIRVKKK